MPHLDRPRPTIAVLLDYAAEGSFSSRPHYALRCGYFDAVWAAGGLPVGVGYVAEARDAYLKHADGWVLPGGVYPFPAAWYGDPAPEGETLHPRFAFESDLCKALLDADKPLLGICAGMQVMGGVLGAPLYRNVMDDPGTPVDHLNERPAEEPAHGVRIVDGTRLRAVTGRDAFAVNTAHAEALKRVPDGAVLNAESDDGLIEGIEVPDRRFALGVQWHPEFFADAGDPNRALFDALVAEAGAGR
jgi:putative glutamine amidotransferase